MQTGIEQAVRNFGSQEAMAEAIGVKQPTVSEWARGERPVPVPRCTAIEQHQKNLVAEKPVRRWDLRPDDWHRIWPELIGIAGAPAVPTPQAA